ncbi:MAG: AAA family ATPase [Candidatus Sericytochromatia bacterium]
MKNDLKPLPLGNATFKKVIEEGCIYVDKTEEIHKLIGDNKQSRYYFLSRPRRFGKSLLISTLEEIFKGNKELFKGLYIYDKIDFKKYPVIKLTMNDLNYAQGIKDFENSLLFQIKNIYETYNIELKENDYILSFKRLIQELSKKSEQEKVVLLIDEYDKPIIEYLGDNIERATEMRKILKNFYETIKANDQYLHFVFLTGVSKFSKTSIFSSLNNITDITLDNEFSKIVGINEEQLYDYFDEYIKILATENQYSIENIKKELKFWYNGYSWDGKNFLYNPYSLLSVFSKKNVDNYWFETGTPTFLIKTIKEYNIDVRKLEKLVLSLNSFSSFDIDNMNVYALLFQTGYLTVKEIIKNGLEREYVLSYPNKEVRISMLEHLLNDYVGKIVDDDISVNEMVRKLKNNDMDGLKNIFISIFGTIAVKMQPNSNTTIQDKELYYHTIFYLIFVLIGSKIKAEVSTNKGFIDAVVETDKYIYIFEFKMGSTKSAIRQIKDKAYYEPYLAKNKQIFLVGVSFDSKTKNIKKWVLEKL